MRIAITGHRPNKLRGEYEMNGPLSRLIYDKLTEVVCDYRPTKMITGMAIGVDMLWANVAIRQECPFIAAIPCYNQEKKWSSKIQKLYAYIINHPLCCPVWVKEGEYDNSCMQERNKWMVNNCDYLIAVWDGTPGGTANCVRYAESVKRNIFRINPTDL